MAENLRGGEAVHEPDALKKDPKGKS